MKNLNQVREISIQRIAEINAEIWDLKDPSAPAPDARRMASLIDNREFHQTVLAMCDRLDTAGETHGRMAVAVPPRNFTED